MLRSLKAIGFLALVLTAASPSAAADRVKLYKLDLVLRAAITRAPEPQRVIIQTVPGRREALRLALQAHGDVVEADHPTLEAMTAYVHGEDIVALANDPSVLSVSCDAEVSVRSAWNPHLWKSRAAASAGRATSNTGELRLLLGLGQEPSAPDEYVAKGKKIGVAILDSGLEMSRNFSGRVRGFWDYTRGGRLAEPYDDYGHGTHVAGLIGSSGVESGGQYQGVAPEASLFVFKVLDKHGTGRTSAVIRALEYISANHEHLGIQIVNLSLGHQITDPARKDPLVRAVENTVRHGLVVIVSSGNNGTNATTGEIGYGGVNSPGNAPSAITVGAADTRRTHPRGDDRVAFFSSRGPTWIDGFAKPDVVAAGVSLVSNLPRRSTLSRKFPSIRTGSSFGALTGTSMAAAVTTGLAALVFDQNRHNRLNDIGDESLTPNAVKAIIEYTATPLSDDAGQPYDYLTQGTGEVNGEGAVRLTSAIDTSAPVGTSWIVEPVEPQTSFDGHVIGWSENIVWGTVAVGEPVALLNSAAWDDNIVWGTEFEQDGENIVWGTVELIGGFEGEDNIVWGTLDFESRDDNIVWGTADEWADNIVWGNEFLGYRDGENIVWGTADEWADNIVWGTVEEWTDNIVWGSLEDAGADNIVWGSDYVWSSGRGGESDGDNIVWGNAFGRDQDNIVWGNAFGRDDDNIVWGTGIAPRKKTGRGPTR